MLLAPCAALGQEAAPAQDSPAPAPADAVPADAVPAETERVAELSVAVTRQAEEIAAWRAAMEQRLAEERAARQAAEASTSAVVDAAVAAALQKAPKVSGLDGLTLSGFIQADLYVKQTSEDQLNTSTGAPLNDDRFTLRRMRLRTAIERRYLAAVAEIDANTTNGPQLRPMNMEVTAKLPGESLPYAALTVGLFKIPFGYEVVQSDRERLFAERSNLARALFPGEYDLGARIAGGWRFVRYSLAVQNGDPIGEKTFPTRDPNAAKDVVGRLGVASPLGGGVDIQAGLSALAGKGLHPGTSPTKPTVTWQDRNENGRMDANELIVSPGTSGLPSQNFSRHALGADLWLSLPTPWLGTTTLYGEITWARNLDRALLIGDPYGPLGRDLREMGYYVAVTQDVGRFLQAGLRYDWYDPDRDSTDRVAATMLLSSQAVSTFAVALAARLRLGGLAGRLLVQYDVNRNHAGRDTAGLPANLASNVLTLRAEAVF
jgi:phosphate-selective porin